MHLDERQCLQILGLPPDSSHAEIRRAYRRLALTHHPDRAGAASAERFVQISAAYEFLSHRARPTTANASVNTARAAEPQVNEARKQILWRLTGPINALVTQGAARWTDADTIELLLHGDELASGGFATVTVDRAVKCRKCHGENASCLRCDGKGEQMERVSAWLSIPSNPADQLELQYSIYPLKWVSPLRFFVRRWRED